MLKTAPSKAVEKNLCPPGPFIFLFPFSRNYIKKSEYKTKRKKGLKAILDYGL